MEPRSPIPGRAPSHPAPNLTRNTVGYWHYLAQVLACCRSKRRIDDGNNVGISNAKTYSAKGGNAFRGRNAR